MPSSDRCVVSCTSEDYRLAHEVPKEIKQTIRRKKPRNVTDVWITGMNRTKNNIRRSAYHFEVAHNTG